MSLESVETCGLECDPCVIITRLDRRGVPSRELPLRVSLFEPARSPIPADGDAGRWRGGRGARRFVYTRSRSLSLVLVELGIMPEFGVMPEWGASPTHASCARWLMAALLLVLVARCCVQLGVAAPVSPLISSPSSLFGRGPRCLSSSSEATVVLVGLRQRSGDLESGNKEAPFLRSDGDLKDPVLPGLATSIFNENFISSCWISWKKAMLLGSRGGICAGRALLRAAPW